MISYAENPDVGVKVVTTVQGDKEYRQNCKHIIDRKEGVGKYYKIGRDCFQFEGRWYRTDSGHILKDCERDEWVLARYAHLQQGIVGFDEKGEPVMGHFSHNRFNNVSINYGGHNYFKAMSVDVLKQNGYTENVNNGVWYNLKEIGGTKTNTYRQLKAITTDQNYKNKGYNIEDNGAEFVQKVADFKGYPTDISKAIRLYARLLGDVTFGAEVELSRGFIPEYLQYRLGIVMCRDGSISGGEAVTVPMGGAKGLQNLKDIANSFKERANVDIHCSYHLHLGNIPTDRAFLCSLYVLAYRIQDELFQMFPYYKTNPTGIKRKNYCQKLGKMQIHPLKDKTKEGYEDYINDVYNRIFEFLSDGIPASEFNNKKQMRHPIPNKWDRPSRYRWLNLQNMIFSDRRTAEFRLHQATLNPQKMTLWLFICNAVIRYAQLHQEEILMTAKKIPLVNVLNYYKDNFKDCKEAEALSDHLIAYVEDRKAVFLRDTENGDKIGERDAMEDKDFVFGQPLF